jgi:cytochrome P450
MHGNTHKLSWLTFTQTSVSMSPYFVHMDPSIFPNPLPFEPDRWIKAAQEGVQMNKCLVNFSKGSRQCLDIK